ncbi:NAD(P)-binding protein [Hymenopellis radicata]|nr:NAD(P)-binding protein [Hymenopellis radicata]
MSYSPNQLSGKVALVTGGGTGLGLFMAQGLAAAGAKVYITGRRFEVLEKASSASPGNIVPLRMDVTNEESVLASAKHIEQADGKLDILINNAGAAYTARDPQWSEKKLATFTEKRDPFEVEYMRDWIDLFTLNTVAPFFVVKAFTDLLVKGAGQEYTSCVINISAGGSRTLGSNSVTSFCYNTSKAALEHQTRSLAADFGKRDVRIRVNALVPGFFLSDIISAETLESIKTTVVPGFVAVVPAKRGGRPDEIVAAMMHLATSEYTNGELLGIDGGFTLVNP